MKVAIVGSGIAGLAAAHELRGRAELVLFEAGDYFGGHTHTVDVTLPTPAGEVSHGVDTGFLVFNERTYPRLLRLFSELDVKTAKSDMSFSVQAFHGVGVERLEWSGRNLNTVFAQRRNLVNRPFLQMLRDLARFNALATGIAQSGQEAALQQPMGDFLDQHGFGNAFRDWYLLPMLACIWSCPTAQMLRFPVATMIRFCHNHGLLQLTNRPQWWTVRGGAKHYVQKILANLERKHLNTPVRSIERVSDAAGAVRVVTDRGAEHFDQVILATHSDQALSLLRDPTAAERATLGAIKYHPNRAVLHTDISVLPENKAAWAAWNYERAELPAGGNGHDGQSVCLHYLINQLQPLPWSQPVVVSLNPLREIRRDQVIGEYSYSHPVFDRAAIAAQANMASIQGRGGIYYSGAWMGYGFHEDGLAAGQEAARQLLATMPVEAALCA